MAAVTRREALSTIPGAMFAQPGKRAPNVIAILTDDQGYGDLDFHDNPRIATPNLARLASQSIEFTRFSVSPVCAPTRAAFLTGRYPLRGNVHGVTGGRETQRTSEMTLGEAFRRHGYKTSLVGKWHLGENYPYVPHARGFDEFTGFRVGHWNRYFDSPVERNGVPARLKGYISDALTDEAISFVERNRRNPFFLYLAYNAPHSPFQLPDSDYDRHARRGLAPDLASVYGMVENLDANIGRLLGRLDSLGLAGETIVAFFCDNGPNTDRYRVGLRARKGSVYEGGTRSPLLIRYPGRIKGGLKTAQTAAHIDMFPTLLDLAGVKTPGGPKLDGESLAPLLGGGRREAERLLFCHADHQQDPTKPSPGTVWNQRFKLVNGTELYDLEADPGETTDISGSHRQEALRLRKAYEGWFEDTLRGFTAGAPPIQTGHREENPAHLPATQAELGGGLAYREKMGYANDFIINWRSLEDRCAWEIDVKRAGRYRVSAEYVCPEANLGALVQACCQGKTCSAKVAKATPMDEIPLPDRKPRSPEAPEMEWARMDLGEFDLVEGRARLALKALAIPGAGVMDLKSVSMRKL